MRFTMAVLALTIWAAPFAGAQKSDRAEIQFEAATKKETVDGDLKGAIELYRKIAQSANRAVAAKALVRMGECYEKLGDAEAHKAYERVVSQYADQREAVVQAKAHLTALGGRPTSGSGVSLRQFYDPKSNPGYQAWNVSADGRFAGATDYATGNAAIIDLSTGKGWKITDYGHWSNEKGYVDQGVVSRDGKQAAFWHYNFGGVKGALVVIDVASKGERVTYEGKADEWGMPADWSPDGRYVVVQLERGNRASLQQGIASFVLAPAAGGSPRVLKTAEYVRRYRPRIAFSPDGRYIAYDFPARKELAQGDIFVIPVSGGPETAVVSHPAHERFVGWAPDGSIVFLSDRTGRLDLYRIRMKAGKADGEPELLRPGIGDMWPLGITRSGALFYWQQVQKSNAYTAALDFESGQLRGQPERLSYRLNDATAGPSWSPDGKWLAYAHVHQEGSPATLLIRQEGQREERELLPGLRLAAKSLARWHADGNSLLALGTKGNDTGLFRIDIRTGDATLVAKGAEIQEWTPDGRYVFYQGGSGRRSIARRDTASGEEKLIHTAQRSARMLRLAPDSQRLVFAQRAGDPEGLPYLGVVPAGGGAAAPLFHLDREAGEFSFGSLCSAWTSDARYVLFVLDSETQSTRLWMAPSGGGQPRPTQLTSQSHIGDLSVHPDGKRIVYTLSDSTSEYWKMENFLPESK